MTQRKRLFGLATLIFTVPLSAYAEGYASAGFGLSRVDNMNELTNLVIDLRTLPSAPSNITATRRSEDVIGRFGFGWRLHAKAAPGSHLALETGFLKLGDSSLTVSVDDPAIPANNTAAVIGRITHRASPRAWYAEAKMVTRVFDGLSVLVKGGAVRTRTSYRCSSAGAFAAECAGSNYFGWSSNLYFGAGVSYAWGATRFGVDIERYENLGLTQVGNEGDVEAALLSVAVGF